MKKGKNEDWLTQVNDGNMKKNLSSQLDIKDVKEQDSSLPEENVPEQANATKKSSILYEEDMGIDRLAHEGEKADADTKTHINSESTTDRIPKLPPGQEYIYVIDSLR